VGVLPLTGDTDSRISKGVEQLTAQGMVVRAPDWSMNGLDAESIVLNEAERCAEEVLRREWL
jgi:hypothetical protein